MPSSSSVNVEAIFDCPAWDDVLLFSSDRSVRVVLFRSVSCLREVNIQ